MKFFLKIGQLVSVLALSSSVFAMPGALFDVLVEGDSLDISPTKSYLYPRMGLTLMSTGYSLGCGDYVRMLGNTYIFSASRRRHRLMSIRGLTGPIKIQLCLDGEAHLNCQNFVKNITNYQFAVGQANPLTGDSQAMAYRSDDGGMSWEEATIFDNPPSSNTDNQLKSISCSPSGLNCAAGGFNESALIYTNTTDDTGTTTWTSTAPSSTTVSSGDVTGTQIWGIKYAKAGNCLAVGNGTLSSGAVALAYLSADCETWNDSSSEVASTVVVGNTGEDSPVLNAVTCGASGQNCVAVGQFGTGTALSATTTDAGKNWTVSNPALPEGYQQVALFGVSCSDSGTGQCIAVGYGIETTESVNTALTYASTDGGATWSTPQSLTTPEGSDGMRLTTISCNRTGEICSAGGVLFTGKKREDPVIYSTTNGGVTWTQGSFESTEGINQLNGIFCSSSGPLCTAVGPAVATSVSYLSPTKPGGSWSGPNTMPFPSGGGYTDMRVFSVAGSG